MNKLIDELYEKIVKETAKEIAVRMLNDKLPTEKVAQYSGLTIEELTTLQKSLGISPQDQFAITQEQSAKHEFVETENEDTTPVFYKSSDVARMLGCSKPTAYQIMHRKDFPLVKAGNRMTAYKTAFEKWAMERRD